MGVVNKYGADALRLYLINSPVVRAENLRFKEEGVRDIIKDVFLPWFNAYRFLFQNIDRYAKEEGVVYRFDRERFRTAKRSENVMDIWITSFKESLLAFVAKEMKAYRLYTVVPRLTKFIDQLTNWYVRLNRRRIKGELGRIDCLHSLDTLFDILDAMVKMMAPFTPFLSEYMYQRLQQLQPVATAAKAASVHFEMMPVSATAFMREDVEQAVTHMQSVIELGRVLRDRNTMPTKYPVPEVVVIHKDAQYLADIQSLEGFVLGELNVRKLTICDDKEKYGVKMRAEPDHKLLGFRLKTVFKAVMAEIKTLSDRSIQESLARGYYEIQGNRVELEEVRVIYCLDGGAAAGGTDKKYEAHSDNDVLVLMDLTPGTDLLDEGIAKEIINRVQKSKKKAQLLPTDQVLVAYAVEGSDDNNVVDRVAQSHLDLIQTAIKSTFVRCGSAAIAAKPIIMQEMWELKGVQLRIAIHRAQDECLPVTDWTNLVWYGVGGEEAAPRYATVLLADFNGQRLTLDGLRDEIDRIFLLFGRRIVLLRADGTEVNDMTEVVVGQTVYVRPDNGIAAAVPLPTNVACSLPFVNFVNAEDGQKRVTILLENPKGVTLQESVQAEMVQRAFPACKNVKDIKLTAK